MSAKITFLGQSTFLGESDKGKKFYIDPWLEGNPRCPEQYKKPESVDFMVLTHGHADHISDVIKVFNTNNCNVEILIHVLNNFQTFLQVCLLFFATLILLNQFLRVLGVRLLHSL